MYVAFRGADGGESVIFSDQADQRLYRQDLRPAGSGRPAKPSRPTGARRGRITAGAARRARPPPRRRARDPGRPAAGERARAARGRRRGGQRAGQPARRRLGRAARHRLRPRLLRRPEAQPGRAASGLAQLGPPADAVGRHRAVDGGARRRRHASPASGWSPAARRSRSCSRSGAPPASSGSPATAPAGGTCTRSRPADASRAR